MLDKNKNNFKFDRFMSIVWDSLTILSVLSFTVLLIVKLCRVDALSWLMVFSPLIILCMIVLSVIIIVVILSIILSEKQIILHKQNISKNKNKVRSRDEQTD